ncbi:MAG TPA: MFS transporter [Chryseolinea sp.]|nr:MFS transporter [Chryseolinea sp.]
MKVRLMGMMFLQFFIWGSWYATGGNYMASHGMSDIIYLAYMVSPIGGIVSPFFMGMVADRFFSVQKVMGVMHILSGIFVICAPLLGSTSPTLFLLFLLFHMLCYMPTVGLASATAFHLVKDKEKEFPIIRLFGTFGWISAGILVSLFLHGDTTPLPMYVSGIAGILMGLYSFTLPDVPPQGQGKRISFRDIIGIDALKKLSSPSFIIFIIGLLLISIPFAIYFPYVPVFLKTANISDPAFKMTFGQMSEVIFLLLMPWFFRKLGIRWVMIMGLLAWSLRYALFALGATDAVVWMLIAGILLHGACYDFVYVASQVYIDKRATSDIRAQAQGFFVLVSYGVGQGLGALTSGWIYNSIMHGSDNPTLEQWQSFWIVPLIFSVVVTVLFALGFRDGKGDEEKV